jgi:hypothetical protein
LSSRDEDELNDSYLRHHSSRAVPNDYGVDPSAK